MSICAREISAVAPGWLRRCQVDVFGFWSRRPAYASPRSSRLGRDPSAGRDAEGVAERCELAVALARGALHNSQINPGSEPHEQRDGDTAAPCRRGGEVEVPREQ